MTAYEYFKDDIEKQDAFIRTIISDVLGSCLFEAIASIKMRSDRECIDYKDVSMELNVAYREILKQIDEALLNPEEADLHSIRFCNECGKPTEEGYICYGDEYYCNECVNSNYTDEELERMCEEGIDDTYYTSWEWVKERRLK